MRKISVFIGIFVCALLGRSVFSFGEATKEENTQVQRSTSPVLASPSEAEQEIRTLWAEGKKAQAEKKLDSWKVSNKKSPAPLILEAEFRYQEKRYSKCLSATERAIDKFPKSADAYYWRGKAFEALNKPMEAANEYQAALMAKTTRPDARESLARVLAQLGNSSGNQ